MDSLALFFSVKAKIGFKTSAELTAILGMGMNLCGKELGKFSCAHSQRLWLLLRLPHEPQIIELLWYWAEEGIREEKRFEYLERIARRHFSHVVFESWLEAMRRRHPWHYA